MDRGGVLKKRDFPCLNPLLIQAKEGRPLRNRFAKITRVDFETMHVKKHFFYQFKNPRYAKLHCSKPRFSRTCLYVLSLLYMLRKVKMVSWVPVESILLIQCCSDCSLQYYFNISFFKIPNQFHEIFCN